MLVKHQGRCKLRGPMQTTPPRAVFLVTLMACVVPAMAQTRPATRPARPQPPARDPHTPGYVEAKELADGEVPSPNADGNFIIGPTHKAAAGMKAQDGVPRGTVFNLIMKSA